MSGRTDWRGIAMALQQLKQIAEPSRLELMEQEYLFRSMEKKKDREFENAEILFKQLNNDYSQNQKLLHLKQNEITEMNADAENLIKNAKTTNTTGNLYDAFEELDLAVIDGLDTANDMIEKKVNQQLTTLTELSGLYSNMTFGKQLRESEGRIKSSYLLDENGNAILDQDQFILDSNGEPTAEKNPNFGQPIKYGWDVDDSGFINPEELEAGLNQTVKWLETNGQDVTGIKEGFWSGYTGDSNRLNQEVNYETNVLSLQDKKEDLLSGGYISEDGTSFYKKELTAMIDAGYSNEFSKFVVTNDPGGSDDYISAMQFKRLQKELNDYKNGEGLMYDYIVSTYGSDGSDLGESEKDMHLRKRIDNFVDSRVKEVGDLMDHLIMNDGKHYIIDLPGYKGTALNDTIGIQNFRTAGEDDTNYGDDNLNKWDAMIEFGFTEDLYKSLPEGTYVGDTNKDVYIGFMLKKEFEFLFDNMDAYVSGKLPQNKKKRFDDALIGFHQRFPDHFKQRHASVMDVIREKSPEVYGTIDQ
tara:strand:+ start:20958 stop:22541 length:1584 start_codon:yes stop_codon:yes gene_type:complete